MDENGSNPTNLTNDPANDAQPAVSSDGSQIALVSNRENSRSEIHVMDADGSNQTNLTNDLANELAPNWGTVVDTPLR